MERYDAGRGDSKYAFVEVSKLASGVSCSAERLEEGVFGALPVLNKYGASESSRRAIYSKRAVFVFDSTAPFPFYSRDLIRIRFDLSD